MNGVTITGGQEDMEEEPMGDEEEPMEDSDSESVFVEVDDSENKLADILTALEQFSKFEIDKIHEVGLEPVNLDAWAYAMENNGFDIFKYTAERYTVTITFAWYKEEGTLMRQEELNFFGEHQDVIGDIYDLFSGEDVLGNPWDGPDSGLKFLRENVGGRGFTIMVILKPVRS